MISRGLGKNKNIIARGFGNVTTIITDIYREVIRFTLRLGKRR